jgi:predicted nucleic acid-binding protein
MNGRSFVDTNVLVYAYDLAEPAKRARALELLKRERKKTPLVVSTQVLSETYVALTRVKKGKPPICAPERAERVVRALSRWTVVVVDAPMILQAMARARGAEVSFWDGLIVEAALTAGCSRLISEDFGHGRTFDALRVESPFVGVED